ncbi:MAG: nitronate monooxygenase [Hyphomicrobiaceae bacterium]
MIERQHFKTRITELFAIRHPILCGGLMWLSDAGYVAASVNAGGMGFMTVRTFPDPGAFRAELQKCRDLTGGKPFGVNVYMSTRPEENRIFETHIPILLEEGVRLIETSGIPPKDVVPRLKDAGCTIMHKVSTVRHAISAAKLDIDAVCVVGAECGGHPGMQMIGSIVQTVQATRSVPLPVAIGGGIGHGSQVAAALAMGAEAVVLGTRMTVASEIWAHGAYKQKIVESDETGSRLVMQTFRNTYRVIDNQAAQAVASLEAEGVKDFDAYRPFAAGTEAKVAYETGDWNRGLLSMGQSAVFADEVKPVAAIYAQMLEEAVAATRRVSGMCLD